MRDAPAPMLPASPIARALAVVGDRWSVLILREAFLGTTRFEAFAAATGAGRATLSKRLAALVAAGLLWRNPYQDRPPRVEYRLTDKGAALYDFALTVWLWEYRHGERAGSRLPARLRHRACGHRFLPRAACARCGEEIRIHELHFRAGAAQGIPALNEGASRRSAAGRGEGGAPSAMRHFVDVVADPWTPLVLAACFMGMRRYDVIRRELGIATNILSGRLKRLVDAGVLVQRAPEGAARLEYRLTDKGRALVLPALALHQWSLAWLPGGREPSMVIGHACSPEPLAMRVECSHCHAALSPREVDF